MAFRQHGVVARRQLIDTGIPPSSIGDLVHRGHLHRLYWGVYALGHRNLTREGRWMAAVLACGPGTVLSHAPAGQLSSLVDSRERVAIHTSVPPGRSPSPRGVVVHRPRALESQDVRQRLWIPCTTATRTVWDLAATSPPRLVRRAFERADGRGDLDRRRIASLLAASPSRKGARLIRELLASRPLPLSEVRSWLEELLVLICSEHSLPLPAINVPVLGYEADFYWPAAAFVVEADGGDHLDPQQRDSDNERDFVLATAGILVRRYSYRAMGRERDVAEEVRATLTGRLQRAPRPSP